jgi:hypothetical protein
VSLAPTRSCPLPQASSCGSVPSCPAPPRASDAPWMAVARATSLVGLASGDRSVRKDSALVGSPMAALLAEQKTTEPDDELLRFVQTETRSPSPAAHGWSVKSGSVRCYVDLWCERPTIASGLVCNDSGARRREGIAGAAHSSVDLSAGLGHQQHLDQVDVPQLFSRGARRRRRRMWSGGCVDASVNSGSGSGSGAQGAPPPEGWGSTPRIALADAQNADDDAVTRCPPT